MGLAGAARGGLPGQHRVLFNAQKFPHVLGVPELRELIVPLFDVNRTFYSRTVQNRYSTCAPPVGYFRSRDSTKVLDSLTNRNAAKFGVKLPGDSIFSNYKRR